MALWRFGQTERPCDYMRGILVDKSEELDSSPNSTTLSLSTVRDKAIYLSDSQLLYL